MTAIVEWLDVLGAASLSAFWLPLTAWTVVAAALLGLLRVKRLAHPLVQYAARMALLWALPLGLLLAFVTDLSLLRLLPAEAAGAAIRRFFEVSVSPTSLDAAVPMVTWSLVHTIGLATLFAGLLAAGRLSQLAFDAAALSRFRRTLPNPVASIQQSFRQQAGALGLRRQVYTVVTAQVAIPLTFGWFKPVIVLPDTLAEEDERLHMTLLHELIHIRRYDYVWQWMEQVFCALFLINPLTWLVHRSVVRYREWACDAEVLCLPYTSRKQYAALLYSFSLANRSSWQFALSMATSETKLKRRILAMKHVNTPDHRFFSPKFLGAALASLLLGTAILFVACSDIAGQEDAITDEIAAPRRVDLNGARTQELTAIRADLHREIRRVQHDTTLSPEEKEREIALLTKETEALLRHGWTPTDEIVEPMSGDAYEVKVHRKAHGDEAVKIRTEANPHAAMKHVQRGSTLSPEEKNEKSLF